VKIDVYKMPENELLDLIHEGQKRLGSKSKVSYPADILKHVPFRKEKQEHFGVAYLDGSNQIIEFKVLFIGTLNKTLVHPREIFKHAHLLSAQSMILCHNHPSGNLDPSEEDISMTERLVYAADICGVKILDHVIIGPTDYTSFSTEGIMPDKGVVYNSYGYFLKRKRNESTSGLPYRYIVTIYEISKNMLNFVEEYNFHGKLHENFEEGIKKRISSIGHKPNITLTDLGGLSEI